MTFGQNRIVLFRQCNRRRTVHLNVATIVCLLLLGAGTTDISNWNQSTKDVSSAVTAGFGTAADVNGDIAKRLDKVLESKPEFGDPAKRYSSVAKAISTRANDYEQLFGAVSDYSSSLAAISRASDNSQQTVDAVAGSLNQLVGAVGGTALAGSGFELSKTVGNEIIKVKAAHDFGEAVQKSGPRYRTDLPAIAKRLGRPSENSQHHQGGGDPGSGRRAPQEGLGIPPSASATERIP